MGSNHGIERFIKYEVNIRIATLPSDGKSKRAAAGEANGRTAGGIGLGEGKVRRSGTECRCGAIGCGGRAGVGGYADCYE